MILFLLGIYLGGAIVFCDSAIDAANSGSLQDELETHGAAVIGAVTLLVIATWPIQMIHDRLKSQ